MNSTNILALTNLFICFREKLGLDLDDESSTHVATLSTRRKQNAKYRKLQDQIKVYEENELRLRMEIQKLSRVGSVLSKQVLELGETPEASLDGKAIVEGEVKEEKLVETRIEKEGVPLEKYQSVVEENDALRKGLHEIMDSIHLKDGMSS